MAKETPKITALFVIHSAGVILALISVFHLKFKPFTNLNPSLAQLGVCTVGVVAGITIILIFLTPEVGSSLWVLRGKKPPRPLTGTITFERAVAVCAVIDLLGLSILIFITGGPCYSMYLPYLLIIVPLIILLDTDYRTVWACFVLTVVIFMLCLFRFHNKTFEVTQESVYYVYFAFITTFCVFFPILLKLIAQKHISEQDVV